eukprot:4552228-Pyramimonas_sp.AAC.1
MVPQARHRRAASCDVWRWPLQGLDSGQRDANPQDGPGFLGCREVGPPPHPLPQRLDRVGHGRFRGRRQI